MAFVQHAGIASGRSVRAIAALTGLLVLLTSVFTHADDGLTQSPRPVDGKPLQMRTLENPPLAYTDDDGSITGILVDGIREAVRRTGHEVEFRIYPWKRVLKEVSMGNADGAFQRA